MNEFLPLFFLMYYPQIMVVGVVVGAIAGWLARGLWRR